MSTTVFVVLCDLSGKTREVNMAGVFPSLEDAQDAIRASDDDNAADNDETKPDDRVWDVLDDGRRVSEPYIIFECEMPEPRTPENKHKV